MRDSSERIEPRKIYPGILSVAGFCWLFTLSGCVVGEVQPTISPDDTTWIRKGQTTRQEIVTKFGAPSLSGTIEGKGEYAEYSSSKPPVASLEPTPQGPFPQAYRPPTETMPEAQALSDRFWVLYDGQGVVQDFGFGRPPTTTGTPAS